MLKVPFQTIRGKIGEELGVSRWFEIDQARINLFAQATDDHHEIHTDEEVGRAGPFGKTIAHGLLTMGLITVLADEVVPVPQEMTRGYYYGFDKVRLVHPVLSGSFLRGRFRLIDYFERAPEQWMRVVGVTVEIKDQDRPALTLETRAVHFIPSSVSSAPDG
jgi:acyl dehydratase